MPDSIDTLNQVAVYLSVIAYAPTASFSLWAPVFWIATSSLYQKYWLAKISYTAFISSGYLSCKSCNALMPATNNALLTLDVPAYRSSYKEKWPKYTSPDKIASNQIKQYIRVQFLHITFAIGHQLTMLWREYWRRCIIQPFSKSVKCFINEIVVDFRPIGWHIHF